MTSPDDLDRELAERVSRATPTVPPPYADVLSRRARGRARRRMLAASLALAVAATVGVGVAVVRHDPDDTGSQVATDPTDAPSEPTDTATSDPNGSPIADVPPDWDPTDAPPVVLQLGGRSVALPPWTYCYGNACADGFPQPPFADVSDRDVVPFSFPLKGWHFTATFTPLSQDRCERAIAQPVASTGDYTFAVAPAGSPGSYQVDLFGRGPEGDVSSTFRWDTTTTGAFAKPTGYAAVVTGHDGELDSYGVEVNLDDLATTPHNATAVVTVTAANGESKIIGPLQQEKGCFYAGHLSFSAPNSVGQEAAALGPAPLTYRVELTFDGANYVGTAVWPRDERPDEAPYTDLTFDPPLPGYTG